MTPSGCTFAQKVGRLQPKTDRPSLITCMDEDQAIVREVLAGRPDAFDRLVDRHKKLVWHILLRMTGNHDDAKDLMQEVFLRVFRKLEQYRFDAALSTWIGRIAYTIALRFLERYRPDTVPFDEDKAGSLVFDPQRELALSDARQRVAAALKSLAPVPRTIVSLYHLQGLSVDDIANLIGQPSGTIKSHLYRARRKMRATLDDEEHAS